MLALDAVLAPLAACVQPLARQEVVAAYAYASRPVPEFLAQLTTDVAVHHVLTRAGQKLASLGAPPGALQATDCEELSLVWSQFARDVGEVHRLRHHPDMPAFVDELSSKIASGVYRRHTSSARRLRFIASGPPPGVDAFPEYTRAEKLKSREVPFSRYVPGHVEQRRELYRQHLTGLPRRQPSARAL
jgi:hypothetical protein